jgi:hypothetical protein
MSTLNLTDQPPDPRREYELIAQMKGGANWFYWTAGLSLVNTAVFLFGGEWGFFAGLAVTQIADALVVEAGGDGFSLAKIIVLSLDLIIAAIFVLCGIFAGRLQLWAFAAGMALYAFDGLIALLLGGYLAFGFHVFVLFFVFRGLLAARRLRAADAVV